MTTDARWRGVVVAGWVALAAALPAATAGCVKQTRLHEYSIGRYPDPPGQLFERTVVGLQALGYVPTSVDPLHGAIVVRAAYVSRREAPAEFHVQLYREGWIAVTITGGGVRREAHGPTAPAPLAAEYGALVLGLREHVEGLERGALGR